VLSTFFAFVSSVLDPCSFGCGSVAVGRTAAGPDTGEQKMLGSKATEMFSSNIESSILAAKVTNSEGIA
jgi:hypothetical protein